PPATAAARRAVPRAARPVSSKRERPPETQRSREQTEASRQEISPGPARGFPHTPRPAGTAGPLDGVWQFTSTPADLRAIGTPQGDIVPENYGTYTIVIDRGRFAFTQEDTRACTWGYGTFTVHGNQFEQLFTDGGGIPPH